MEKRFIIYSLELGLYYTGIYYDEENAWDISYDMAQRYKSEDEVEDIIIGEGTSDKMRDFFKKYNYLEIKTIYVK